MTVIDNISSVNGQDQAPIPPGPGTINEVPTMQQIGEIATGIVESSGLSTASAEKSEPLTNPTIQPHVPKLSPNHHLGWTDLTGRI